MLWGCLDLVSRGGLEKSALVDFILEVGLAADSTLVSFSVFLPFSD